MMMIESPENAGVKRVRKLLDDKKYRLSEGCFVLEGLTMLLEAVNAQADIEKVYVLEEMETQIPAQLSSKTSLINQRVLEKISDTKTPQGVVFTCTMPKSKGKLTGERIIALEGISDPGNMGTILRTADAMQMNAVVLLEGCVDIFSSKAVRATMGSLFRVPIFYMTAEQLSQRCIELDIQMLGAALTVEAVPIENINLRRAAVVIGNEAHGITPQTLEKCSKSVVIPIKGAESLNAAIAAAIFMWQMR